MKGFIGFYDILGYQSFLANNPSLDDCEAVLKEISSSGDLATALLAYWIKNLPDPEWLKPHLESVSWLTFSDTIVHTVPTDNIIAANSTHLSTLSAVRTMMAISGGDIMQRKSFFGGLPIRGVLHFGEFLSYRNCLAGTGIVDAYKAVPNIDLSCVVLTKEAKAEIDRVRKELFILSASSDTAYEVFKSSEEFFLSHLIDYLVPYKDGSEAMHSVISWPGYLLHRPEDLDQEVYNSFWAHNKTVDVKAETKLRNTIKFFRFIKSKKKKDEGKPDDTPLKNLLEPDSPVV